MGLEAGDDERRALLAEHLAGLTAIPIDALLPALLPALTRPESGLAPTSVAWLALFQHPGCADGRVILGLLGECGAVGREAGLRTLASWTDPRAEALARIGLEHGPAPLRGDWLGLFADRGWAPSEERLDEALASSDAKILVPALRIAGSRPPEQVKARVSARMFGSAPAVRLEAIETGLVLGDPSAWMSCRQLAWMSCRQLARSPAHARAAQLVALLGSADELGKVAAARSGDDPGMLELLGLAGRPEALAERAADLDPDAEHRDSARAAFAVATGVMFESADQARAWLAEQSVPRLIDGTARSLDAVLRTLLATQSLALREAIARELRIRTGARVILATDVFAHTWRERLAELAERDLDLDLDREFPWTG
jgi:hypothetical protein